jgi:cytochrome P450
MQEALRMYPPVAVGQVRVATSHDITLGGRLRLPAGTVMWVPHHAIQNASFNWDQPDKFLPGGRSFWPGTWNLCMHPSSSAGAC